MSKRDRTTKTCTRLTHPLVRDSRDEPFRRATESEALTRAAAGLSAARGAFGMFASARATNETSCLAQKFARVVMGTCVDACGDQWQNTFAISVAGRGFEARIAVEHDAPLTDSACVYRGVGCNLTLHVQDNESVKVTSPHDEPVTR